MIEMVTKESIRKKHLVDGWSIRKISKQCNVSRPTIRKMLLDADIPKYTLTMPRPRPKMERWLDDDRKPGVPIKQRQLIEGNKVGNYHSLI